MSTRLQSVIAHYSCMWGNSFLDVIEVLRKMLPNYLPVVSQTGRNAGLSRNEIIVRYFNLGLSGPEILLFLLELHGIRLYIYDLPL